MSFLSPWSYGLLWGWAASFLIAASDLIRFDVTAAPFGIFNYCVESGYPKQKDYFWYAVMLLAGWGGAAASTGLCALLRRAGVRGAWNGWPSAAGILGAVAAMLPALSWKSATLFPAVALPALAGLFLPWWDRNWYREERVEALPRPPGHWNPNKGLWAAASVAVAILWCFDMRIRVRALDPMHEGYHLLNVQAWLSGEVPGVATRTVYGPLYTYSLIWWMKAFGMTVLGERSYFMAAQILGVAVNLVALRWICRSLPAALAGVWLILTLTTASHVGYGWSNALRTAIPLAALVMLWKGSALRRTGVVIAAGGVLGAAFLYSHEYAIACVAASATLFITAAISRGRRETAKDVLAWGAGLGAACLGLLVLVYGFRLRDALGGMLSGDYALARLFGHGALPFRPVPWLETWHQANGLLELTGVFSLWWPGLLACGAGAWLMLGRDKGRAGKAAFAPALLVLALFCQVPALVRPMGQIGASAAPAVALAALVIDLLWSGRGHARPAAIVLGLVLSAHGAVILKSGMPHWLSRAACGASPIHPRSPRLERLGGVRLDPASEKKMAGEVALVRSLCPPGSPVYDASLSVQYLCFLADRAPLGPYPSVLGTTPTDSDRAAMLEALERRKPPLVLIERGAGLDGLPYRQAHAREWAYIRANYSLRRCEGEVGFYTRNER